MNTPKNQGEGGYEAARNYDEAQRRYAESGKVEEQAARDAAPQSQEDAEELKRAEEEAGKARAKEEDPAVALDNTKATKVGQKRSKGDK